MGISAALAVVLYLTPVNENVLIYDLRTGRKKKKKRYSIFNIIHMGEEMKENRLC